MNRIGKLQLIAIGETQKVIIRQIEEFLAGGGNWVQLELDVFNDRESKVLALKCSRLCTDEGATLILTDKVDWVESFDADGVLLRENPISPKEVRAILGSNKLIGKEVASIDELDSSMDELDYLIVDVDENPMDEINIWVAKLKTMSHPIPLILQGEQVTDRCEVVFSYGGAGVALIGDWIDDQNIGAGTLSLLEKIGRLHSRAWKNKFAELC